MPGDWWCRNCSGFLRITHSSEDANAEDLHTEDASRINPTQYELAKVSCWQIARTPQDSARVHGRQDDAAAGGHRG